MSVRDRVTDQGHDWLHWFPATHRGMNGDWGWTWRCSDMLPGDSSLLDWKRSTEMRRTPVVSSGWYIFLTQRPSQGVPRLERPPKVRAARGRMGFWRPLRVSHRRDYPSSLCQPACSRMGSCPLYTSAAAIMSANALMYLSAQISRIRPTWAGSGLQCSRVPEL